MHLPAGAALSERGATSRIRTMPTYEYRCSKCDHTMEVFASMSDPAPEACESCNATGTLSKVLFAPAIHFKGSGFYNTDYKGKTTGRPSGGEGGKDSGSGSGSSEGGSSGGDSGGSSGSSDSGSGGSSSGDSGSSGKAESKPASTPKGD